MIIFGQISEHLRLGPTNSRACPACRQEQPFSLLLEYDYAHLYYLFGFVTRRRFRVACDRCGNVWKASEKEIAEARPLARGAVPFLHRWGCLVFIVLVIAAVATAIALGL